MVLIDIGRVCYKIAGRESGKLAVVVDTDKSNNVLIDGNLRRKKCNIAHLEPTEKVLKIKKGASTADVHKAMKAEGLEVKPLAEKKNKGLIPRPKKQRKVKEKPKKSTAKKEKPKKK